MHAYLISGGTDDERHRWLRQKLEEWHTQAVDVMTVSPENLTIGIRDIRELEKRLMLVPLASDISVGVLESAESLTVDAQNALLKTLEEPPARARLILLTGTPDMLLPTIASRCVEVRLTGSNAGGDPDRLLAGQLEAVLPLTPGKRLAAGETWGKTRGDAETFLISVLSRYRRDLVNFSAESKPTSGISRPILVTILRLADKSIRAVKANVSPKHAIDMFLLELPLVPAG